MDAQNPSKKQRAPFSQSSGFFRLRCLGDGFDPPCDLLRLRSNRLYTVGRNTRRCHIVLTDRRISRRHCHLFLDGSDRTLRLVDGSFLPRTSDPTTIRRLLRSVCEGTSGTRVSLNGISVNRCRLRGSVTELAAGDEVLFGCNLKSGRCYGSPSGFVVEEIDFSIADTNESIAPKVSEFPRLRGEELASRAAFLLSQCRRILEEADPVSYLRSHLNLDDWKRRSQEHSESIEEKGNDDDLPVIGSSSTDHNAAKCDERFDPSVETIGPSNWIGHAEEAADTGRCSDGKTFFLNRLQYMDPGVSDQHSGGVTLQELIQPVETLVRVFIATFTYDVSWFLSCCQVPNHLPVTISCHNAESCWSVKKDGRTSSPYSDYPNLLLVYPQFPDVIAFGKDPKNRGVACHHPKLFLLQREDGIRVVVTSANLNSKQWNHVTNTVWWQDFPSKRTQDYTSLFGATEDSENDFATQLAGFIATLITDVPSQAHWIAELTKYDFSGAVGHLVASVPGLHAQKSHFSGLDHCLSAKQFVHSHFGDLKILGSIETSVVGLSHRFHSVTDSNGGQLKTLASVLGKNRVNSTGPFEVLLKRNINIPADANAVSILVADLDEFSEEDYVQLGFLPRDVANWVSPLSDARFFCFYGFIYPKEALEVALGESNMKVQLLLSVTQGPKFCEMSRLIQPEHFSPLCSLIASISRCLGLWRIQEVLSQYKWPEALETDFIYGSSSIGTSVNAQFIASFSAAAGKKSFQFADSEESDPEWGCWNTNNELRNPSMKIVFPTIQRVKNGAYGVQSSRRLLSFSEKTWHRLRDASIFHDAIPHPGDRVGYPMHVKIACRRFQSRAARSSFGWIYCGSHNFSPAAWGRTVFPSSKAEVPGAAGPIDTGTRLHICNYELGIIIIAPPPYSEGADRNIFDLDHIVLPFVVPAPKYQGTDRPATAQAMREVLAENAVVRRDFPLEIVGAENMDEDDIPDEEEELLETSAYPAEEKEEERVYAEMLWSQVDSFES